MDLFVKANTVRLISYRDKYLVAEDDQLTVSQASDGSTKNAIWTVEFAEGKACIRLKSCFGTYLTATSMTFLRGFSGKKVIQRWPSQSNFASEWEPLRDGMQVRLRSLWGYFLRPNSGLPPWRNSVMHDVPHMGKTREKVLWNIEVVEKCAEARQIEGYAANGGAGFCAEPEQGRPNQGGLELKQVILNDKRMESYSNVRWPWFGKILLPFSR